ncbi:hypothetical protein [Christiangramia flava]|uniref:Uncharacterized protein n=1 Tax=Christiangramia flava JLT2011 TaxID=1229726 RepID=A0A1L7I7H0_9FLAO|nr:hypothetical protein [Christiangramia flava]APU69547.1 hypothetical protein GRFL_2823 [Christiangramia flava JLT2011]OSS37472.1 hypothetical protein C723_3617 [Christiangramia flava JLT2011]
MRILLLFFLIILSNNSFACECSELNKNNVNEFKANVDYIIIGTVINQLNPEKTEYLDYNWEKEKEAYDIIVKVKKVFKGSIQSDTLYITQYPNSNCSRTFSAGKDYIFTGKEIKKFINTNINSKRNYGKLHDPISDSDSIPIVEMENIPPPEYKFERGILYVDFENTDQWNLLLKKHPMILTNQCYSYNIDDELGQVLIR